VKVVLSKPKGANQIEKNKEKKYFWETKDITPHKKKLVGTVIKWGVSGGKKKKRACQRGGGEGGKVPRHQREEVQGCGRKRGGKAEKQNF